MAKASSLKGKRILFRTPTTGERLLSGVVEEISPSGSHVRVGEDWHPDDHVRVVEELPALKTPKAILAAPVAPAAPKTPRTGSPANTPPGNSGTPPAPAGETTSNTPPAANA